MKHLFVISISTFLLACNNAAPTVVNSNQSSNSAARSEQPQTMIAHSSEDQAPKPVNSNSGKRSQSGDPIDTSKFDEKIREAEKATLEARQVPGQGRIPEAKLEADRRLAEAFFERGFALTEARQYASALGDYRRALKLDPAHEESKKWMDQIISIYAMLKKEAPKEGEEPPPLPMQKPAR